MATYKGYVLEYKNGAYSKLSSLYTIDFDKATSTKSIFLNSTAPTTGNLVQAIDNSSTNPTYKLQDFKIGETLKDIPVKRRLEAPNYKYTSGAANQLYVYVKNNDSKTVDLEGNVKLYLTNGSTKKYSINKTNVATGSGFIQALLITDNIDFTKDITYTVSAYPVSGDSWHLQSPKGTLST